MFFVGASIARPEYALYQAKIEFSYYKKSNRAATNVTALFWLNKNLKPESIVAIFYE